MLDHLWDENAGRFVRMVIPANALLKRPEVRDVTPDLSLFGLHFLGVFDATEPKLIRTLASIEEELTVRTGIGGMARYSGDYYHAVTDDWRTVPGNPWFIGQSWLARWRIANAKTKTELEQALEPLHWMERYATASRLLPEQIHPFSAEPLAVTPLTWSHAAYVAAVHDYLECAASLGQ
jgi:GH15 family glucan-1,4-alpha-glucosidase